MFVEGTRHRSGVSLYGRAEAVQVESDVLATGLLPEHGATHNATVGAITLGAVRDVLKWRGTEGGLGAQVTFHATPESLRATHGDDPVSFQIFFRLRPPAGAMGRMWNMRMSQPMAGHDMAGMSGTK